MDSLPELEELTIDDRPTTPPDSIDSNESNDSEQDSIIPTTPSVSPSKPSSPRSPNTGPNTDNSEFMPIYTDEQMKAMNEFYKLKGKYDEIVRRKKQKIINNPTLSKADKRKAWANTVIKCINCKQNVGTFFSVKNRRLIAHCGAVGKTESGVQPCKLNIDLELATVTTMQETINSFNKFKEDDKESIIKTKLKLLFGFMSETEALSEFEEKRKEFDDDVQTYNEYLELFTDIHNSKEKRDMLKNITQEAEETIKEIKKLIRTKSKDDEDSLDAQLPVIRDAVTIQVTQLDKLLYKIRQLKYDYYAIEEDDDNPNEHILVSQPISIVRSEVVIDKEPKLNQFVVK